MRSVASWLARAALVLLVAGALTGIVFHTWVAAQVRAAAVMAVVLDVPVASDLTRSLTSDPVRRTHLVAGSPTDIYRPDDGPGTWPAIMFITGADDAGRRNPDVVRLSRALARAGFVVLVPDVAGLKSNELGTSTLAAAVDVADSGRRLPEVRGQRLALASVCAGTSVAVLIAAEPRMTTHVTTVGGITPFADVRTVVRLATTSTYRGRDGVVHQFESEPRLRRIVAASLIVALRQDRRIPPSMLTNLAQKTSTAEDPFAPFLELPAFVLSQRTRAAIALVTNRDPDRFDALYAGISPRLRAQLEEFSPIEVAGRVDLPVHLAVAPRDSYFPRDESEQLAQALPDATLEVSDLLRHARTDTDSVSVRGSVAFDRFLVRFLRDARR